MTAAFTVADALSAAALAWPNDQHQQLAWLNGKVLTAPAHEKSVWRIAKERLQTDMSPGSRLRSKQDDYPPVERARVEGWKLAKDIEDLVRRAGFGRKLDIVDQTSNGGETTWEILGQGQQGEVTLTVYVTPRM